MPLSPVMNGSMYSCQPCLHQIHSALNGSNISVEIHVITNDMTSALCGSCTAIILFVFFKPFSLAWLQNIFYTLSTSALSGSNISHENPCHLNSSHFSPLWLIPCGTPLCVFQILQPCMAHCLYIIPMPFSHMWLIHDNPAGP